MAEDSVDMTWWTTTIQAVSDKQCLQLQRKALKDGDFEGSLKVVLRYMNNRKTAHDMMVAYSDSVAQASKG